MRWLFLPGPKSECANDLPEIILTVTGSGTHEIRWYNEIWNLPTDSGQEKTVCPRAFQRSRVTFANGIDKFAKHQWGDSIQIYLNRAYRLSDIFGSINTFWYETIDMSVQRYTPGSYYSTIFFDDQVQGDENGITLTLNNTIGLLTAAPVNPATSNDYLIDNDFFGSYVDPGTGITYTWERGRGWPGPVGTFA